MDLVTNSTYYLVRSDWRLWSSIGVLLVFTFGYWYYTFIYVPHTYGPLSKIPGEGWPLWGRIKLNYHTVMGTRPLYIHRLHRKYGNIVLVGVHMVSFIDKESVDKIYSTYQFRKTREYKLSFYTGDNIFTTSDGQFHSLRRRIITPIVANNNLDKMEEVVYKTGTVALVDHIDRKLKRSPNVDLFDAFHRATTDIVLELFFGSEFQFLKYDWIPFIFMVEIIYTAVAVSPVLPFLGLVVDLLITLVVLAINIIWAINPPVGEYKVLLNQFFSAKDSETGKQLTWTEAIRDVMMFLGGAMDSPAITSAWTFWLMLKQPEVYREVQREVDRVFPNKNVVPDADTCKASLPILEAVILESMRLLPISGDYLPRLAPVGGTTLSGFDIPEHTMVFCSPLAYHHNPELWTDPDEFHHERWLIEDNSVLKAQIMTFSQGPRGCPGRALSWIELFLISVGLVQRYNIALAPGQDKLGDHPLTYFTTKPNTYKLKVRVTPREF